MELMEILARYNDLIEEKIKLASAISEIDWDELDNDDKYILQNIMDDLGE